jgi:O-antigen/teichoic acid export membrane protein
VLLRGLAILAVAAGPALLIFATVPHLLLKVAFGAKFAPGGDALFVLGLAFSVLACVYLGAQYLLALGRWRFLVPLLLVTAAEPFLLLLPAASRPALAVCVLVVQVAAAAVVVTAVVLEHRRPARR